MNSLLELKGVLYKADEKRIIDGLDMCTAPHEVHALLGTNGTGKSTFAYLIMGCKEYKPEEGDIFSDGQVINDLQIHEWDRLGITMAWQEPVRFEGISVRDYISIKT